jgi:hypothetical protein
MVSFTKMKQVPDSELDERLEEVKVLTVPDRTHEHYRIVKDRETGEHYLHYACMHIDIAGTGEEEWLHHLLPLESDDVLALVFGEQSFTYPEHWHKPFLRSSSEGFYVWFDPGEPDEIARYAKLGKDIASILAEFKQKGQFDEQSIRRMMERLDRLDPE